MRVRYLVADPTKNLTLVVLSPVPEELRAGCARRLMELEPSCEQAGFLTAPPPGCAAALCMAGGEFCGNAAMSAAAIYAQGIGIRPRAEVAVQTAVSGAPEPVTAVVSRAGLRRFHASVSMPLPERLCRLPVTVGSRCFDAPAAVFPGITHILLPGDTPREDAERAIPAVCGFIGAPALGFMLLDEKNLRLQPLVCVPGSGTLFWEHSCASGTSAVGAMLAAAQGTPLSLTLREPGGKLRIDAQYGSGGIVSLTLHGSVTLGGVRETEL